MTDEPAAIPESTEATPERPVDVPTPDAAPVAQPKKKKEPTVSDPYVWGTGRRKTSVARVRIRSGDGKFIVNKREADAFFCIQKDRQAVRKPLEVTDTAKSVDVYVRVGGGGISGQAGAVMLGLARALRKYNSDYEPKLREFNLLSRDPRKVERKKYGQRGARRRFQFSKR